MVATCLAARRWERTSTPAKARMTRFAVGHVLGGIAGGTAYGAAVALVVYVSYERFPHVLVRWFALTLLSLLAARAAGLRCEWIERHLFRKRQVPQAWAALFPSGRLGLLYGFVLGTGVTTTADIAAPQMLAALGLIAGSASASIIAGTTYGAARTILPVVLERVGVAPPHVSLLVGRTYRAVQLLSGPLTLFAACSILVS